MTEKQRDIFLDMVKLMLIVGSFLALLLVT